MKSERYKTVAKLLTLIDTAPDLRDEEEMERACSLKWVVVTDRAGLALRRPEH